MRIASAICSPTVITGFSELMGSWNTTEMSLPRRRRMSSAPACSRSRPSNSTRLAASTMALAGSSRTMLIALTLLPLPDSPTRATVAWVGMSKEMPRTASWVWPPMRKATFRSRTSISGLMSSLPEFRVHGVAQGVGQQRERRDEDRHEGGGGGQLPPLAEHQFGLGLVEHGAP